MQNKFSCFGPALHLRIQISQHHRLIGIRIQFCVTPERFGNAFILIEGDRWQRLQQPRSKIRPLFLWQAHCLSSDLLGAHTTPG